ncbi:MAG TPA: DUF2637 domain-containing protein, partial [Acidimicrobiales bacterium]
ALPIERRNGSSVDRPSFPAPAPVLDDDRAQADEPVAPVSMTPGEAVESAAVAVGRVVDLDPAPAAVSGSVRGTTTVAVLLVAVVAAVASYEHMRALAVVAGEGWRSWLLPISVDGLAVAASMTMLMRRRAGLPAGGLAWAALLLGLGASMAANVAAAQPTVAGRLVAAWPPVALLLAYELLMQQLGHREDP